MHTRIFQRINTLTVVRCKLELTFLMASSKFSSTSGTPSLFFRIPEHTKTCWSLSQNWLHSLFIIVIIKHLAVASLISQGSTKGCHTHYIRASQTFYKLQPILISMFSQPPHSVNRYLKNAFYMRAVHKVAVHICFLGNM